MLLALAAQALAGRPAPGGPTTASLLDFVVHQNTAAREKITSYSFKSTVHWSDDPAGNAPPLRGTGRLIRQGESLWSTFDRTGLNKTTGQVEPSESRVVVNDKFVATWPSKGNPLAYQNDHTAVRTMDTAMKNRVAIHATPDFTAHSFGESIRPFTSSIGLDSKTKWDAVEVNGDDGSIRYEVRRFMPTMDDPSKPDAVWVVDPRRGFLATEMRAYKPNGDIWIRRSMQVEQVVDGIWFPTKYSEDHYGGTRAPTPKNELTRWRKISIEEVKLNEQFPPAQFEIGAMRLNADNSNVAVIRTLLDGSRVAYAFVGDGLVPQKLKDGFEFRVAKEVRLMGAEQAAQPPGDAARAASAASPPPRALPHAVAGVSDASNRRVFIAAASSVLLVAGVLLVLKTRARPGGDLQRNTL